MKNQNLKTSTNLAELKSLDPCPSGLEDFERMLAHLGKRKERENDQDHENNIENILFSTCLQHIDLYDCFWFLGEIENQLSKSQIDDLHLMACEYAESCLHVFEEKYPDDKRPRAAIEAKRAWVRGECTDDELGEARDSAWAAAWDARAAACAAGAVWDAAAWAADRVAWDAVWDAARVAWIAAARVAWIAAARVARVEQKEQQKEQQKEKLMQVIKNWEQG